MAFVADLLVLDSPTLREDNGNGRTLAMIFQSERSDPTFPGVAELFRPGAAKRWQGSRVCDPVPTSAIRKSNFLIRISRFPIRKSDFLIAR